MNLGFTGTEKKR